MQGIANKGTAACRGIGISLCASKVNEFKSNHLSRDSPLMSVSAKMCSDCIGSEE